MESNFTNTTLLIKYLDAELDNSEKTALETALRSNESLQQELDNLRFARQAVASLGLRRQVAAFHSTYTAAQQAPVVPMRSSRRFSYYALRVAAVALVAVTLTFFYQYFSFSADQFYASHYEGYTLGTSRGTQEASPLEQSFRECNYAAVLTSFTQLNAPDAAAHFYAGLAALETNDLNRASELLNGVMEKNKAFQTSTFQEEAEYYLALTYIKLQLPAKALPLVEKIQADPRHLYHGKFSRWDLLQLRWHL